MQSFLKDAALFKFSNKYGKNISLSPPPLFNYPTLQPPGHRCVAVAYLSIASANHLPDSDLR